jgi:hypothetical protein
MRDSRPTTQFGFPGAVAVLVDQSMSKAVEVWMKAIELSLVNIGGQRGF